MMFDCVSCEAPLTRDDHVLAKRVLDLMISVNCDDEDVTNAMTEVQDVYTVHVIAGKPTEVDEDGDLVYCGVCVLKMVRAGLEVIQKRPRGY